MKMARHFAKGVLLTSRLTGFVAAASISLFIAAVPPAMAESWFDRVIDVFEDDDTDPSPQNPQPHSPVNAPQTSAPIDIRAQEANYAIDQAPFFVRVNLKCRPSNGASISLKRTLLPNANSFGNQRDVTSRICMRYGIGASEADICVEMESDAAQFDLTERECPTFVMPDAGGVGAYSWSLNQAAWRSLVEETRRLSSAEAKSFGRNLWKAFQDGQVDVHSAMRGTEQLARSLDFGVAVSTLDRFELLHETVIDRYAQRVFHDRLIGLMAPKVSGVIPVSGAPPKQANDEEQSFVRFMALIANHPELKRDLVGVGAALMAYPYDAPPGAQWDVSQFREAALGSAVEEIGAPFVDHLITMFARLKQPPARMLVLKALARAPDRAAREKALTFVLSPALRGENSFLLLSELFANGAARKHAWTWLKTNFDAAQLQSEQGVAAFVKLTSLFCDASMRTDIVRFFSPRTATSEAAVSELIAAQETINACSHMKENVGGELTTYIAGP
jgi:alanyl aminopeptidase